MNQLRRIAFVNSANVPYREILLDGHIHFIGTQGTGKSTVLRAILFFYNADQRKLGISKEKKPFADYYFPYADSYIFYEVQVDERRFCVWLYKHQNRLCFRFVDGGYDPSLAIEGRSARSESDVMKRAGELGFKVERAIYSFSEYRDILYGENRTMRRYALLRNTTSYSTIPRTISNIFLNANLDGDHIKKTMIDSLSDEPIEINLETNRHHLETARRHYSDVMQYQRNEAQAEQIVTVYSTILRLEEQQRDVAWKIGAAVNQAREQARGLSDQIGTAVGLERAQREKLDVLNGEFETEKRRLGDRLAVIKKDISHVNFLKRDYAEKGIEAIQEAAQQAPLLTQKLANCAEKLRVLTAQVAQQEQQFDIAASQLKNGSAERIHLIRSALSDFKDQTREELDSLRLLLEKQTAEVEADYNSSRDGFVAEKAQAESEQKENEVKLRQLDHALFFESERTVLHECKTTLEQQRIRAEEEQKQNKAAIEALQREAEHKQKIAEADGENRVRPLMEKRSQPQNILAERKRELDALSGSLLEYLDAQVPDWSKTIGKVVRRDVLLQSGLEPKLGAGHSCYGVELKLAHLESEPLSKAELETAIRTLEAELSVLSKNIEQQLAENRASQDALTQQYNRKIRELQEHRKSLAADLFKLERDLERNAMDQRKLAERVVVERENQQRGLEEQRHILKVKIQELEAILTGLAEKRDAARERLSRDYRHRKKALEKALSEREAEAEAKRAEQQALLEEQIRQLQTEREARLNAQGVDVKKVAELEEQAAQYRQKLDAIKQQERLLIEYEKDRREWIDKLDEFQRERGQLEHKLEHQSGLFERRIRQEKSKLNELSGQLNRLEQEKIEVTAEIAAFEQFEQQELFVAFESFIRHHDRSEEFACRILISELINLALQFEKQFKLLAERITAFSGLFAEHNCLGFETHLTGELSFRNFAQNLTAFVMDQKIITLKTEVTRKYSMVLEAIVTETNRLLQREDEVHRVVRKMNDDFQKSNFVGVVNSIEMRIQQSSNRVFQVLRELCRFQAEHHMSFGELDLFNRGNNGNDEKAVELLDQLRVQMGQAAGSRLRLEDALELEFRVCENENDTSWVNRLANVGSNGTDVLVKSMIYINLLNIFKTGGQKESESTVLHCLVDEVGILHDSNVKSLIHFAADRGICMINGSPNSHNEQDYKHIYMFRKDADRKTAITTLLSHVS